MQLLNGVAGGAGEAVLIEAAIYLRILGEPSREYGDGIVAAIAVARKFNAFGPQQDVYAGAIERRAKGVGMQRLAPLAISFRVTSSAIFRGWKSRRRNKVVANHGRITGSGNFVRPEVEIVGFAYFGGIRPAVAILVRLRPPGR